MVSGSPSQAAADLPDASVDAFISTYVLDILSDEDIDAVLTLAQRYSLTEHGTNAFVQQL